MKKKIIYYNNFNDDFCKYEGKMRYADDKYVYEHKNIFYRFFGFVWYRIIFTPIAFFYCKLVLRQKFVNKNKIKECKEGYFIYGNHTNQFGDAYGPNILTLPNKTNLVVGPENISIPIIGKTTPMLGAIPIPSTITASKNFIRTIENKIKNKEAVVIYPEAKIWPYYTNIREFKTGSFKYPAKLNSPSFCMTTTYQTTKKGKMKMITYIDGPFFSNLDENSSLKEKELNLQNQIYGCMKERCKKSTFEKIKYIQKEKTND